MVRKLFESDYGPETGGWDSGSCGNSVHFCQIVELTQWSFRSRAPGGATDFPAYWRLESCYIPFPAGANRRDLMSCWDRVVRSLAAAICCQTDTSPIPLRYGTSKPWTFPKASIFNFAFV